VVQWFVGIGDSSGKPQNQIVLGNNRWYRYAGGAWNLETPSPVKRLYAGTDPLGRPATVALLTDGSAVASNGSGLQSLSALPVSTAGDVVQWFVGISDSSGQPLNNVV